MHNPECVVKCGQCKKWFCNDRASTAGSHIVNHLVRSRHKEVCLHAESPLGETTLECYNCSSKNIFLLGFIPKKSEGIVVLICREPCLSTNAMKDLDYDVSLWSPLVEDKALLHWLVRVRRRT